MTPIRVRPLHVLQSYEKQLAAERRWDENQILRLERMNALEKLSHLFLEFPLRLSQRTESRSSGDQFSLPLTQKHLADPFGLAR